MTLIALAVYGTDRAEFITDSTWYTYRLSRLGRCTKHVALPHLDAAVICQGDSAFNDLVKALAISGSAAFGTTFDEIADELPRWLSAAWASNTEEAGPTPADSAATTFLVGWSDRAGKFVAWGYASDDDFEPFKIPGLFVTPCPWTMRPSKLEVDRVHANDTDDPRIDEIIQRWKARSPQPPPRSEQEWLEIAIAAREQRAYRSTSYNHVIVAGDVFHTRLKRGSVETRKIHTFNDAGDELLRLVEHTEHPVALAAPCYCDSGKTYGDCHALEFPCGCRSGKAFGKCHSAQGAVDA